MSALNAIPAATFEPVTANTGMNADTPKRSLEMMTRASPTPSTPPTIDISNPSPATSRNTVRA